MTPTPSCHPERRIALFAIRSRRTPIPESTFPAIVIPAEALGYAAATRPSLPPPQPLRDVPPPPARDPCPSPAPRAAASCSGSSAMMVPIRITCTPIQIHSTSGFTCALMIGLPCILIAPGVHQVQIFVRTRAVRHDRRRLLAGGVEAALGEHLPEVLAVLVDVHHRPLAVVVRLAVLRVYDLQTSV